MVDYAAGRTGSRDDSRTRGTFGRNDHSAREWLGFDSGGVFYSSGRPSMGGNSVSRLFVYSFSSPWLRGVGRDSLRFGIRSRSRWPSKDDAAALLFWPDNG